MSHPRTATENAAYLKAQPGDRHAFRGRRIKRGGIWHFIPDDGPTIKATCGKQEDAIPLAETQPEAGERLLSSAARPAGVGTICECGCLLRDPDELCPACVIPWCRAQEAPHKQLMAERANRRGYWQKRRNRRVA